MGREEIIGCNNTRSGDDLAVVAPYFVADFNAAHEIAAFTREVARGEQSARIVTAVDSDVFLHRRRT